MKTKEIYPSSLNIYNRAWLNTYLAKTPILITVEFQELLEIFTGIFYLHLHSYSSLAKTWLLYETGFLSGLSFPHPTLPMVECSLGFLSFGFVSSISRGILQFEAKGRYTNKNLERGWLRKQPTPAGHASEFICYEATRIRTNRPFALWHHFTTTTRILQGFAFLCKLRLLLFKPHWDYKFKYERKNEKDSGRSSKMIPSCKWPIK